MSYETIEAKLQTLLQALSRFEDEDVTRGDYRILDLGIDSVDIAILRPGTFTEEVKVPAMVWRTWETIIDLFYRFDDDGLAWTNFIAARDDVVSHLEKYPTLDSTSGITTISISAETDPEEVFDEDEGGPFFLWQALRVAVTARADITGGEFPA